MSGRVLVSVAALGLLGADSEPELVKREHKRLEATWRVVRAEVGGTAIPAKEYRELRMVFKGDGFTARRGDEEPQEGSFRVNPAKNPKEMDITRGKDPARQHKQIAIYQLTGELLTICSCDANGERPTSFDTREHPTWTLMVLRRIP
jgi:uncharacterized protein (TIGR03067 family)